MTFESQLKKRKDFKIWTFFKYGKAVDKITHHFRKMETSGETCKDLFRMSKE